MNSPAPITNASDQAARLRRLVSAHGASTQESAGVRREESRVARGHCPIIAIASGKGGVGKTVLSVNLSIALARSGHRVTLLDADLGTANADLMFGVSGGRRLEEAFIPEGAAGNPDPFASIAVQVHPGVRLIPGAARLTQLSGPHREILCHGLEGAARASDCILIDTGAGIGPSVMGFLDLADFTVVVATTEPTSIADAYALIKQRRLNQSTDSPVGLVVNQARHEADALATHGRIDLVARRFLG